MTPRDPEDLAHNEGISHDSAGLLALAKGLLEFIQM